MEIPKEKHQISKNDDNSITLIKGVYNYRINVDIKSNKICFICKMFLSAFYYEASYTMEDLRTLSSFFSAMDTLDEVYDLFIDKYASNDFEFQISDEHIIFKFILSLAKKNKEVEINLKKTVQHDSSIIIDEMSRAIQILSEKLNEANKKNLILEEKLKEIFNEQSSKLKIQDEQMKNFEQILNEHTKKFEQIQIDELKKIESMQNKQQLKLTSSKILREQEIPILNGWLTQSQFNANSFQLLYRASDHGKAAIDFHSRCNNKGPTVTFIKSANGKRFGGFTSLSWDSTNTVKSNDPHAFLFSLDKTRKLTCSNQTRVIYCYANYGVIFGAGHDICISNGFDSNSLANCPSSFGTNESVSKYYLIDNSSSFNFVPEEVEVYQVQGKISENN